MKQSVMKRVALGSLIISAALACGTSNSLAANSVVVSSLSSQGGASNVQIGVALTNDVDLRNIVIPLKLRTVYGGAFLTKLALKRNPVGRLNGVLTGISVINGYLDSAYKANGCSVLGIPSAGFKGVGWADTNSHVITDSMVGVLFSLGKLFESEAALPAGTDGANPSLLLVADIAGSPGQFEVDSLCASPANHLVFALTATTKVIPAFTKGVITVNCPKAAPAPSGPTPANGAQEQPDSVILKWGPLADSCGVPVTYDVYFGTSCGSLDLVTPRDSTVDTLVAPRLLGNTDYFWKVVLKDFMGRQTTGPCWSFKTAINAVQYLGGDGIPRAYSLDQNYPNPFNASTVIKFNTKHDGHVRLEVFNILGQKVRTLVDEFRHFGPQAADWDGADVAGQPVATGLYFYRLVSSDYTAVKKMMLLK